ncbi:hypothetical protein P7B02_18840 [Caulobacter segnis]|uniref:hypothetical protein n=1 Tax=Caulobacter segnis TaxID=88688 RepID=UPI00240EEA54|nr:hypothetical protein [Caulobacter segnis]MDG2523591.1 hypothetical protein [Caulobacter segnis]
MIRNLAAALLLSVAAPAAQAACLMTPEDSNFANRAIGAWSTTARQDLQLSAGERPTIVLFDQTCAYTAGPAGPVSWNGVAHGGQVKLPDGQAIPARVASFAAPFDENRKAFFVMALPSIWQGAGVDSALGLEGLMQGVLIHEMTHTRQFYYVSPRLAELTAQYGLPDDLSDDSLQAAFAKDEAYVAAYEDELGALFQALNARSETQARAYTRQALAKMRARRAQFFVGDNAKWAPLDDLFLTMEGLGQWAAFAWTTRGRGVDTGTAVRELRRGGRFWSQDEGLVLFLLVDRLVPDWQSRAFDPVKPALAEELLALAAGG